MYRLTTIVSAREARWIALVLVAELWLLAIYFAFTPAEPTSLRYLLYPFVWINVGLWVILKTAPPTAERRHRAGAAVLALSYFLVLAALSGLVGVHTGQEHQIHAVSGLYTTMGAPGWGPAVAYVGETVHLSFVPYLVIGYLALAYLVYVTVLDAAGAALSGVLGLATCVGCAVPVVASLVAGVAGGSSALTVAVYSLSIDISTGVFVLAATLLYWRPGYDSRR
ncbi:DUF7546 family protein [Natronorarus salvus]|uniref:DUF7546 family protein n=1 Tax=Natronorarus salvus TaxID=3117733 RepID=UPI002F26C373